MRTSIFCLLVLFTLSFSLYGQDFTTDLGKMKAAYHGTLQYKLKITYNLYKSHLANEVYERTEAQFLRNHRDFHYSIFGLESLMTSRYVVVLDHDSKFFMIDKAKKLDSQVPSKEWNIPEDLTEELDALLQKRGKPFKSVTFSKTDEHLAVYQLVYNYGELEEQKIYFNPQTFYIQKIVQYFREKQPIDEANPDKPRLEIIYQQFDPNPSFAADQFSIEKYASIIPNRSITLKPAFKTYQIINHLWLPGPLSREK